MKAMTVGDTVVLVLEKEEAENIRERISCSSFTTFDNYRSAHNLSGLRRHPLAENLQKALGEMGADENGS